MGMKKIVVFFLSFPSFFLEQSRAEQSRVEVEVEVN